jgi:hypothetical protein
MSAASRRSGVRGRPAHLVRNNKNRFEAGAGVVGLAGATRYQAADQLPIAHRATYEFLWINLVPPCTLCQWSIQEQLSHMPT